MTSPFLRYLSTGSLPALAPDARPVKHGEPKASWLDPAVCVGCGHARHERACQGWVRSPTGLSPCRCAYGPLTAATPDDIIELVKALGRNPP